MAGQPRRTVRRYESVSCEAANWYPRSRYLDFADAARVASFAQTVALLPFSPAARRSSLRRRDLLTVVYMAVHVSIVIAVLQLYWMWVLLGLAIVGVWKWEKAVVLLLVLVLLVLLLLLLLLMNRQAHVATARTTRAIDVWMGRIAIVGWSEGGHVACLLRCVASK